MTKEDYEKRLMAAAVRVVREEGDHTIGASDNLPGAIKELAAILAEQDARIAAMEGWKARHDHSVEHLP